VASSIGAIPVVTEGSKDMKPIDEYNSEYLEYLDELRLEERKRESGRNKGLIDSSKNEPQEPPTPSSA
jgi:hypothetical protein